MRRYIVRCADFSCLVHSVSDKDEAIGKLPICTAGLKLYPSEDAEICADLTEGCPIDECYIKAILSHLLSTKYGYPRGVYSASLGGKRQELVIDGEDKERCSIFIGKCEELFTKEYKTPDNTRLVGTDVECDGRTSRFFFVSDSSLFSRDVLKYAPYLSSAPYADASSAVCVKGKSIALRSAHHPIPSFLIRALSFLALTRNPDTETLADEYTSSVFRLEKGRIILPFWCGDIS